MIFNLGTFLFEVVNFAVVVYVLRRILYRPLHDAIDARRQANEQAMADARKAREEAEALQRRLDERLAALDRERQDVVRKAREQAETEAAAIVAEAERAAQARREQNERQREADRAEAFAALRNEIVQSARNLAERFVTEAGGASLQERLTDRLVAELERVPDAERLRLRAGWSDGETGVVESAAELGEDRLRVLDSAVSSLAGREVALARKVDPSLLCGLRLRLGGQVWDATLRGGLGDLDPGADDGRPV
jgi:F-type H+-transporting ATPase subunit b